MGGIDAILDIAQLRANPSRHKSHGHHGRRSRVDDVGQFLARHLQLVGNRAHRVAHHERVGIVVEEDAEVHEEGHQLSRAWAFCPSREPVDHSLHPAVGCDDAHHAADNQGENDDRHMVGIEQGTNDVGIHHAQQPATHGRRRTGPAIQGHKESPSEYTDKQ